MNLTMNQFEAGIPQSIDMRLRTTDMRNREISGVVTLPANVNFGIYIANHTNLRMAYRINFGGVEVFGNGYGILYANDNVEVEGRPERPRFRTLGEGLNDPQFVNNVITITCTPELSTTSNTGYVTRGGTRSGLGEGGVNTQKWRQEAGFPRDYDRTVTFKLTVVVDPNASPILMPNAPVVKSPFDQAIERLQQVTNDTTNVEMLEKFYRTVREIQVAGNTPELRGVLKRWMLEAAGHLKMIQDNYATTFAANGFLAGVRQDLKELAE